jgi:hypothetical protein
MFRDMPTTPDPYPVSKSAPKTEEPKKEAKRETKKETKKTPKKEQEKPVMLPAMRIEAQAPDTSLPPLIEALKARSEAPAMPTPHAADVSLGTPQLEDIAVPPMGALAEKRGDEESPMPPPAAADVSVDAPSLPDMDIPKLLEALKAQAPREEMPRPSAADVSVDAPSLPDMAIPKLLEALKAQAPREEMARPSSPDVSVDAPSLPDMEMPPAATIPPALVEALRARSAALPPSKAREASVAPPKIVAPAAKKPAPPPKRVAPAHEFLVPYEKSGHTVIDTDRPDSGGHVPTHRLDQPSGRKSGQTFPEYEAEVLARKTFSPDTAQRSDLKSLQPVVADSARSLIKAAKDAGVKLGIAETRRTQERQEMLFQKGRKKGTGDVVTWTLTSDHTPGRAIDFHGSKDAYNWLQKNAGRFGFQVLGAMDPGHVGMP